MLYLKAIKAIEVVNSILDINGRVPNITRQVIIGHFMRGKDFCVRDMLGPEANICSTAANILRLQYGIVEYLHVSKIGIYLKGGSGFPRIPGSVMVNGSRIVSIWSSGINLSRRIKSRTRIFLASASLAIKDAFS